MKKILGRSFFSVLAVCAFGSLVSASLAGTAVFAASAYAGSQPYTFKSVRTGGGGGYIVDVIFNPTEQDLIYAKTDMGGAYRWEPATSTWKQLLYWVGTDDWNWTGVESLATDPVDPNNLYMAVGTYVNDWAQTNGAILRSSDKGETFTRVDLPFKLGGNMNGRGMGERLVVDPNKNNILYFGARAGNGLWRSDDYGATWTQVANFPDPGTFVAVAGDAYLGYAVGVPWVIFDKTSGTAGSPTPNIYVGVATNSSGAPNLYRSTDTGATWEAVPGQPTCAGTWGGTVTCTGGATWTAGAENSYSGNGVGYLPHSAKFDSAGTLYITYSDWEGPYNGGHGDVWKYVPSTGTWTLISPVPGSDTANNYFGYGGLAVDLQNPGTIMVAAVNSWWPQGQMWRSTDGGATWRAAWTWGGWPNLIQVFTMDITNAPWLNFGAVDNPPVPAVNLGWMMEGFNIDPFNSNRAMYGTGATLSEITGLADPIDGDKWMAGSGVVIKSQAVGIEETSVNGLVSPPSGTPHLFSVMADVSGFRHDDLDAAPPVMYSVPYAGTYHAIDFAENNPQFLARAGHGSLDTAFSTDGGATWVAGPTDIAGATAGGTIAASADGSVVVWAPPGGAVSYSTDMGATWVASTGGIPNGAYVASDRVNANKFYAFGGGAVYVSTDGGVSFTATVTGLPTAGQVKAVPGIEGDVWLVTNEMDLDKNPVAGDGIYHSTDSGATFTKLTSGITYADVIGFGMHALSSSYPAIFTSAKIDGYRAVYRSDDMGASWFKITDSQHQYATIQCLTGDPRIYGRVYLGTNGLGIISGDIAGPALAATTTTLTSSQNPSTVGQSVTFTATVAGAGGTPTGTVAFKDGGTDIAGCGAQALTGGTATCSTSALTLGSHTLSAVYSGDTAFNTSTGNLTGNPQVVKTGTTTTIVSSQNPSTFGQSVTFTATVTATAGTPAGNVVFYDAGTVLDTRSLAAGLATLSTATLPAGTHVITAAYAGDTNFSPSTDQLSPSQTVDKAATITQLGSSVLTATYGSAVTFTATVTSAFATPDGSVTFYSDGSPLGAAALLSGGVATLVTSALPAGWHTITATYSGNTNFITSPGTLVPQLVVQAKVYLPLVRR